MWRWICVLEKWKVSLVAAGVNNIELDDKARVENIAPTVRWQNNQFKTSNQHEENHLFNHWNQRIVNELSAIQIVRYFSSQKRDDKSSYPLPQRRGQNI